MSTGSDGRVHLDTLAVPLERDVFLRTLIRHLAGTLQDVVGLKEASGFISIVGQRMGDELNDMYRAGLHVPSLDRAQVAQVCVDLKARIQGDFYVVSEDAEKIVFGNRACPFLKFGVGDGPTGSGGPRPSSCLRPAEPRTSPS